MVTFYGFASEEDAKHHIDHGEKLIAQLKVDELGDPEEESQRAACRMAELFGDGFKKGTYLATLMREGSFKIYQIPVVYIGWVTEEDGYE